MLDDYSRFLLASDLKPDMTADSISDVVEQAVAFTGMRQVPIEDRTKLLSDHGSGYLARAFEEYLRMLEIRHIYCAPHHPQTNGKIERFHETLRARMNLLVYTSPDELRRTMQDFMEYYNHRRYHEAIGNVTPADVYYGRRDEILRRRAEQKQRTIEQRLRYNLGRWNQKLMGELKPKAGLTGSEDEHREEAEKFYRELASRGARVRVGMEASGHARWFERLLAELNFELWIGDAAEIRAKRVRKQKDRSPGCTAHSALAAEG